MAGLAHALAIDDGPAREVGRVLAVADRLHPELPPIPVRFVDGATDVGGYVHHRATALGIDVSADSFSLALTGGHELGHYVDHQLLGRGRFASDDESDVQLAAWREAVRRTDDRARREYVCRHADLTEEQAAYLLSYREEFARSYAQWLLLRSADPDLLVSLSEAVAFERTARHVRFTFEADDFAPVAAALDELMA